MLPYITDVLFKKRTPRVVAIVPSYIASCQINVVKPLTSLARSRHIEFKHVTENAANSSHIGWADLVVFCRNTERGYRHLIDEALGRRRPVIYDIDDSFWDIPKSTDPDLARYHLEPSRLAQLEHYLQSAALVRVYSPLLKEKVSAFTNNAKIYRSSFDFNQLPSFESTPPKSRKIGIVYATSRTVDDQYKVFLPALSEFLHQHHAFVEMTVWGCMPSELMTLPGVTAKKLMPRYDDFLREFSRSDFQIGLAPLLDNEFNRSKNNTKFRDYGACGIAGIYSDVDAYSSSVAHMQDGLLVANTKDAWLTGLNQLVFDENLRQIIRTNARKKVFQDYRQELIEEQWLKDIQTLLSNVPSFQIYNSAHSAVLELPIEVSHDGLCAIHIEGLDRSSSGERDSRSETKGRMSFEPRDADGRMFFELQGAGGRTLRSQASYMVLGLTEPDPKSKHNADPKHVTFAFEKIRNSGGQTFTLRITGVSRSAGKQLANGIKLIYAD